MRITAVRYLSDIYCLPMRLGVSSITPRIAMGALGVVVLAVYSVVCFLRRNNDSLHPVDALWEELEVLSQLDEDQRYAFDPKRADLKQLRMGDSGATTRLLSVVASEKLQICHCSNFYLFRQLHIVVNTCKKFFDLMPHLQKRVAIFSLGSGELLLDWLLVTRLLQVGYKNIFIACVDTLYEDGGLQDQRVEFLETLKGYAHSKGASVAAEFFSQSSQFRQAHIDLFFGVDLTYRNFSRQPEPAIEGILQRMNDETGLVVGADSSISCFTNNKLLTGITQYLKPSKFLKHFRRLLPGRSS